MQCMVHSNNSKIIIKINGSLYIQMVNHCYFVIDFKIVDSILCLEIN